MEKITVTNCRPVALFQEVNKIIVEAENKDVSDGYHTIEELYDHRITLYIALCRLMRNVPIGGVIQPEPVWRSVKHSDGSSWDGWFILGIGKEPRAQITYHLPISRWEETDFAQTYDKAPVPFDGHTSADVLERLKTL